MVLLGVAVHVPLCAVPAVRVNEKSETGLVGLLSWTVADTTPDPEVSVKTMEKVEPVKYPPPDEAAPSGATVSTISVPVGFATAPARFALLVAKSVTVA